MTFRCRICGHEGPDVSHGIYRTKAGRFLSILRCRDHDACQKRQAAT